MGGQVWVKGLHRGVGPGTVFWCDGTMTDALGIELPATAANATTAKARMRMESFMTLKSFQ
jgi:hypothetical protein